MKYALFAVERRNNAFERLELHKHSFYENQYCVHRITSFDYYRKLSKMRIYAQITESEGVES